MKYLVTRDLTEKEKGYSDEKIKKGDIVYRFYGQTYGCIADGEACSKEEGENPFFEMPLDSIEEIK